MDQESQAGSLGLPTATTPTTAPITPASVEVEIRRTGVICVDLDGTLARCDAFGDALVMHVGRGPLAWAQMAAWLTRGRASAKAQIAQAQEFDPSLSPYNTDLIDWLRGWKAQGVRLVLATAADISIARAVAEHLDLFDDVIASDGTVNLKSTRKAEALVARYGTKGFVYIGDSTADLKVWPQAAAAVAVNAKAATIRRLEGVGIPVMVMAPRRKKAEGVAFLKAIRPHQWSKNVLIFVPILTAGDVANLQVWLAALLACVACSLTASGVYLINDALDMTSDRRHPRKRFRPFASGSLPVSYASAALPIFALGLGFSYASGITAIILIYIVLTTFYSFYGKKKAILDVVLLAMLYSIRLYAGGVATGHEVSAWLLAFSGFLFFNLATMKRYGELYSTAKDGPLAGRGYSRSDLPFLLSAGMSSGFSACVVLTLFVQDNLAGKVYANPGLLWALAPIMLVLQLRLWHETTQGRMTDDPILFAARDRATLAIVVLAALVMLLAQTGVL
jgi:4-hydroxybenzoate polyprenyltransferase/phosphoserine phosphatase